MAESPVSSLSRQANLLLSRRTTAQAITGGGLAALLSLLAGADAKNNQKKRKRRKKKRNAPTCAEQCQDAKFCFNRAAGPPLCGDSFARAQCIGCSTDQDCVDSADPSGEYDPYCPASLTQASDNAASPFDCGDGAVGACTTVIKPA